MVTKTSDSDSALAWLNDQSDQPDLMNRVVSMYVHGELSEDAYVAIVNELSRRAINEELADHHHVHRRRAS